MIPFWLWAVVLCGITGGAMVWVMARLNAAPRLSAVDVLRGQLTVLGRDKTRGLIGAEDYAALRADVGRKLLAAAKEAGVADKPAPMGIGVGLIGAIAIAAVTYLAIGQPSLRDLPLAARLAASEAALQSLPPKPRLRLPTCRPSPHRKRPR